MTRLNIRPMLFVLGLTLSSIFFFAAVPQFSLVQAATLYWVGANGANTSVATNWSTTNPTSCSTGVTVSGSAPTSADTLNFDADCDNSAMIDASSTSSVSFVVVNSGYVGTVTQGRDFTVAGTFATSGGTWTAAGNALSIASTFTMNAGSTFIASSGITTFSGAFTVNGGTFNHNSGTVNFTGTAATLSCNSVNFNLVTFNNSGTKTVNSNCSLPLGSNPTLAQGVALSGTLSGSGTLSQTAGTVTLNSGAILSGFSGFTNNSTFTVAGATADFSGYSSFTGNGQVNLTSGSLSLPSGADLNSTLSISNGTFTAPSGTMTLAGALTITGSPTFNANGGTITFDGGTAGLTCNNVAFNLVRFNDNSGNKTVSSNCTLPLGNNPNLPRGVSLSGTLSGSGTLTAATGTSFTMNAGAVLSGFSGLSVHAITANGATLDLSGYSSFVAANVVTVSSGSLALPSGADLNGVLNLTGGTFTAPSGAMTLAGALTITNTPTFNANGGTITFDGTTATINCTKSDSSVISFNRVAFNNSSTKTVASGCVLPLGNNPTLTGAAGVALSGTLSGTGKLTMPSTGTLTLNSGAVLTGFNGLSTAGLTVAGATVDLSSYTSFASSGTVSVTSGSLTLPNNADLNAALSVTGGTLNAPTGNMTLASNMTIGPSATFNANGGTLIFDVSGTLTCNNAVFSNVVLHNTGLITVNSGCNLPLGNNPNITASITSSGTFSGTGTLIVNSIPASSTTLTLNTGASLSGFTGINYIDASGTLTMNGAALDLSNYTTAALNRLILTSGTFTAPSGTLSLTGAFTSGAATFNANGGVVNFTGSSNSAITIACSNITFHAVNFTHTAGTRFLSGNCSIPIGHNPTLGIGPNALFNLGGGTLVGTGTLTSPGSGIFRFQNTGAMSGFTEFHVDNGNLDVRGDGNITVDLSALDLVSVGGYFQVYGGGTVIAPKVMRVNGYLELLNGSVFNPNNGTVVLAGTDQLIESDNFTFYNLTKSVTQPSTLSIEGGKTITVLNDLTLTGTAGNLLTLQSRTPGTSWSIDARGARTLQYLTVQDSNNINGTLMSAANSVNGGNTSGWLFPNEMTLHALNTPTDRQYVREDRPSFSWKPPQTNPSFDAVRMYALSISSDSNKNFELTGIPAQPAGGTTFYETPKYRVEYQNWEDSDLSNNIISVRTKSSTEWSKDQNDGKLTEGKVTWTVQMTDSSNTDYRLSRELFADFTSPTIRLTTSNTTSTGDTLLTSESTPTFSGRVIDQLSGNIASGPKEVLITIEKKDGEKYSLWSSKTIPLTETFWEDDGKQISDNAVQQSSKYGTFTFTPDTLGYGTYRITMTASDQAENAGSPTVVQLTVTSRANALANVTSSLQKNFSKYTQSATKSSTTPPAFLEQFRSDLIAVQGPGSTAQKVYTILQKRAPTLLPFLLPFMCLFFVL